MLSLNKEGYVDKPAQHYSRRFARRDHSEEHVPRKIPQGTHRERRHTHRYNAETQVKRQTERGGSRNSKTANRLSECTLEDHCRRRCGESVPHITLLRWDVAERMHPQVHDRKARYVERSGTIEPNGEGGRRGCGGAVITVRRATPYVR